jgi:hypothetical protein
MNHGPQLARSTTASLPDSMTAAQFRSLMATGRLPAPTAVATGVALPQIAAKAHRNTPEEDLQRACFEWAELMRPKYPILRWLFHVPNGGKRPRGEAGKLKAMGTKTGVPDFLLNRPCGRWGGLALELKSAVGRLSADQKQWLDAFNEDGYLTGVGRTLDEFIALVMQYLQQPALATARTDHAAAT